MKLHNICSSRIEVKVRKATSSDKSNVLEFCKNTFQWGDYIHEVWETWHSDPNGVLLVAEVKPSYPEPNKGDLKAVVYRNTKSRYLNRSKVIGVAHACVCPTRKQLWIEGIRINSKYRRMGIASKLIDRMIEYGREFDSNIREVAAITAKANTASRSMLEKNKFRKRAKWEFYTGFKEDNSHQTIMHNSA